MSIFINIYISIIDIYITTYCNKSIIDMLKPIDNYNIIDRLYINYTRSNHHLVISKTPKLPVPVPRNALPHVARPIAPPWWPS